jgi:hypothetical protein
MSSVFGNLYGLVKAFLKDFYTESKRGTLQHKKGIAVFLAFVFLCLIVLIVVMYKISEKPFFCGLCHNMKVYVDSWKASTHRNVECIKCHYKPGLKNHLKGKWQDGQLSLVYFVTGKSPTKPHAEIDDASCLQKGCHKRADLKDDMVFKNVLFSHPRHIEQMRRQKQLRCTTCHSQIVQGAHMTVTDVECFICHFYKTKDQKTYVTGCPTCHFEARGDISVDNTFTFNHKRYIDRGIKCEQCHTNVISGDGHIPEFACLQCHNKREILEAKHTPEFLHRNHVTIHKVECFTCHSPIKHQITGLHYKGQPADVCAGCHAGGEHVSEVSMYLGRGARFVPERANRMALINMDCDVCHERGAGKPLGDSCKDCHGSLTDGMVERWKKILADGQAELSKQIAALKAQAGNRPDGAVKKLLDDAQYNYDLLRKGDGVHNIVYASDIINGTSKALKAASSDSRKTAAAAAVSCTNLCHSQIADTKVSFGSVSFPHAAHIDGDKSCLNCHTPYANHGRTVLQGCSSCHHGEGVGKVRCTDCHRPELAMFKGAGVNGIPATPDPMFKKVACTDCHTAIKQGKKASPETIKTKCVRCHDKDYAAMVDDWRATNKNIQTTYSASLSTIGNEIVAIENKEKRHSVPVRARFDELTQDVQFLLKGSWSHNPQYGEAIAAKIDKEIKSFQSMIKAKQQGREIILKGRQ